MDLQHFFSMERNQKGNEARFGVVKSPVPPALSEFRLQPTLEHWLRTKDTAFQLDGLDDYRADSTKRRLSSTCLIKPTFQPAVQWFRRKKCL